jgi:hypothetical protein
VAVSLDAYGPYDSGAGANITENFWRSFMGRMRGEGSSRSGIIPTGNACTVYADSSGRQVKVMTGTVWIEGAYGNNSTEKIIPIATADPTNPRKDRIVCRNDFVNNRIEWDALTGTPAGSPTPPPYTQDGTKWEISVAIVDVPANDLIIDAAQVTPAKHYQDWPQRTKTLTADQTVNNSTTFVNITDLQVELSANRQYAIDASLFYDSATAADARVNVTVPSGATIRLAVPAINTGATFTNGNYEAAVNVGGFVSIGGAGVNVPVHAMIRAVVTTLDTSGNLTVQWAQDTANASNTVLRSGSWLRITPLQ